MSKDAYYFSHDANARNDEKILSLRRKFGWEGYGIFWAIVEKLRDSEDYTLLADFELISYDLRSNPETVRSIVCDFRLFTIDENSNRFYSESLCSRMEIKRIKSEQARAAAQARWEKEKSKEVQLQSDSNTSVMQTHSDSNTIKGKESKSNKLNQNGNSNYNVLLPLEDLKQRYLSDTRLVKAVTSDDNNNITVDNLDNRLTVFNNQLVQRGCYTKAWNDYTSHFINWNKKQPNHEQDTMELREKVFNGRG